MRSVRLMTFISLRRAQLALGAAGDGGDELIYSLGAAQGLRALWVKAGYEASLALLSDHETAVSRRTSPQPLGRRFSLVPYRPLAASCAAIDCVERFGQSGVIVVWL